MEDVRAKEPYPPFAASVKDGYAVIGNITYSLRNNDNNLGKYFFICCWNVLVFKTVFHSRKMGVTKSGKI